jgi:hypothetical protein
VIFVAHHLECLRCGYDLCGLAAEAYIEVYRGRRIAIPWLVRCPECGLLQRYLGCVARGRPRRRPLQLLAEAWHERVVFTTTVVVLLVLIGILVRVLIS